MNKNTIIIILLAAVCFCGFQYLSEKKKNSEAENLVSEEILLEAIKRYEFYEYLQSLLEQNPGNYKYPYYLATDLYYNSRKDAEEKPTYYEMVCEEGGTCTRSPEHKESNPHTIIGRVLNFTQALSFMNRSLELKPDFKEGYILRGKINYKLKNYPQAFHDYEKAVKLDNEKTPELVLTMLSLNKFASVVALKGTTIGTITPGEPEDIDFLEDDTTLFILYPDLDDRYDDDKAIDTDNPYHNLDF
ncbi:tetratricopeptide (TPR) repeat protein [Elusimicrobium posterum]|uniref:tetratricopeptide repeat protein n=1 Tax=Elusimicrobium posterum TaxID=3116653 RepID=UPI003C72BD98